MVTGPRVAFVSAAGAALVALGLFVPTLLPGVAFWDTAEFQVVGPLLGTAHPTGFPAYVVLGWLASVVLQPFGEPAFRMNLLSALLVASAVGLTVVLVRQLSGSVVLGIAAGLGLAMTPIAWRISTHADAHALHLALVALLLVVLVGWEQRRRRGAEGADRWLVVGAVVFGVAAANHSLTLLLPPAVLVYVHLVEPAVWRRPRLLAACAVALLVTLVAFYLELPLRAGPFRAPLVYGHPETFDGFRYVVLAEQFRGSIVDPFGDLGGKLASLVDLTVAQFGPLALLIPVGFVATLVRQPRYALLSGIAAAITVFFAASYVNAEIDRYYLGPVLIAWTWLAILAAVVAEQIAGAIRDGGGATDGRTAGLAALLLAAALLAPGVGALDIHRSLVDRHDDLEARSWLDTAEATFPPDAVVVSWWSYSTTLWYGQHIEGRLPGVFVVDDRTRLDLALGDVTDVIDDYLATRPVLLIRARPSDVAALEERYRLERTALSNVWRVVAPVGASR